jgi:peptidoglycan hydrolase-like protein with peptidoglycan-binding domain
VVVKITLELSNTNKTKVKKMTFTDDQANASAQLNKPVLKEGSRGEAVEELQLLLQKYCAYSGPVDGIFGSATTGAVRLFQYRVFLTQDGIVGDKTWRALYKGAPVDMPTLKRGSKGQLVKTLQERLHIAGEYAGEFDGDFGSATEAGVKSFQQGNGLSADGIVGDRTWFALSKVAELGC